MVSLDRVPGTANLYLGGLFSLRRKEALEQANITHVLSVLRLPLDEELFAKYKHHVVEVDDVDDENLLEHFAATNAFIQDGLDGGGGVLVHCAMGKSRSTTCIIAYLMHKDRNLTPQEALSRLRQVRSICEPNDGFMEQLELYHQMHCPENIDDEPAYQRWLYRREVEMSVACGSAPDNIRFQDEATNAEHDRPGLELRCRKCRRKLATSQHLVPHTPKSDPSDSQQQAYAPISTLSPPSSAPSSPQQCAHLFLDPLSWMRPELERGALDGRLECPKCKTNVGKYAWQGMRCSCGAWVVPGISLGRAKIDEVRPRTTATATATTMRAVGLGGARGGGNL
ncbi:tyrosine protein phosphatase yvh1 [Acarospora aff. strigata]|nr:tyrosine protein phosphatase yvh1 [Acarospora aff. strigata]